MTKFSHPDYGTVIGHSPVGVKAVAIFSEIVRQMEAQKVAWIADLRGQGIKAAHPDDGWVDRERNSVQLTYPQFNDGPAVGDQIALGWPDSKTRIVQVTKIAMDTLGVPQYFFEQLYFLRQTPPLSDKPRQTHLSAFNGALYHARNVRLTRSSMKVIHDTHLDGAPPFDRPTRSGALCGISLNYDRLRIAVGGRLGLFDSR